MGGLQEHRAFGWLMLVKRGRMMRPALCLQGWMGFRNAVPSIRRMVPTLPSGAVY